MFCGQCGKEIPHDSRVCSYCGAPVEGAEGSGYTQPAASQPYQGQPNVQPYQGQPNVQPYQGQPNAQPYQGQPNAQPYQGQPNAQPYQGQPNVQPYQASPNGQPCQMQPYNQPYYNGQQYYNGQSGSGYNLKPDNKYNLVAALFTWLWALFKGMWDLALFDFAVGLVFLIPVVGWVVSVLYLIFRLAILGRNANYYYRLKVTMGIPMYKAIMDPNLRRL
jgi:hypothetical protein